MRFDLCCRSAAADGTLHQSCSAIDRVASCCTIQWAPASSLDLKGADQFSCGPWPCPPLWRARHCFFRPRGPTVLGPASMVRKRELMETRFLVPSLRGWDPPSHGINQRGRERQMASRTLGLHATAQHVWDISLRFFYSTRSGWARWRVMSLRILSRTKARTTLTFGTTPNGSPSRSPPVRG